MSIAWALAGSNVIDSSLPAGVDACVSNNSDSCARRWADEYTESIGAHSVGASATGE